LIDFGRDIMKKWIAAPCLAAATLAAMPAAADEVADFYKGKQMVMLVAYGGASTYGIYARALANHFVNHIPGKPTMIVQNKGGAGGMVAAGYLYNAAPQDGSWLGAVGRGLATEPVVFGPRSKAKFDPSGFHWLGSLNNEAGLAAMWHASGINSVEDARNKEVHISIGGVASDSGVFTMLSKAFLGAKFKIVCCFSGGGRQNVAMERGEIGGRVGWSWSSVKATKMDWYKAGKIKILYQLALRKHPDLPNVPLMIDLVKDPKDKAALELALIRQSMGRPYLAPPGAPKARVAALRAAFDATVKDPAFLAEAKKLKLEIDPTSGDEIEGLLKKAAAVPKDVVARLNRAVDPKFADVWHKYKRKSSKKKAKKKDDKK
jgi:tripartite-type tricarboxylate transporter receptor subunit TctC